MADLRIVDAPLLSTVKGTEKLPTGGEGNFSVSVNQVADFAKLKWVLATEGYVNNAVGNVQADLNLHKNNESNPHNVTKTQVGLGNVDNTADLDKPVSNATQSAIITANSGKADKVYVDSQDQLKADKVYVDSQLTLKVNKVDVDSSLLTKADKTYVDNQLALKSDKTEIVEQLLLKSDKTYVDSALLTKADKTYTDSQLALKADKTYVDSQDLSLQTQIDQKVEAEYVENALSNLSTVASKFYPTLAEANADIANITVNQVVNIGEFANGGLWYKATAGATSLTKSPYDPLTQSKNHVANTGYASIVGVAVANINYTTSDRKLTFANTIWVTTGTTRYQLAVPQSVNLPLNTPYRLQINTTTKLISAVTYTDAMVEGNLILGFVTASTTTLKTIDFAFAVNGINQDAIVLARQYVNDTGYGRVKPTSDSNINFDSVNSVLEFKNTIIVNTETLNYQITTPQNIALSTDGTYRIEINTANRALRAVAYIADRAEGYVVLGYVKKNWGSFRINRFWQIHY